MPKSVKASPKSTARSGKARSRTKPPKSGASKPEVSSGTSGKNEMVFPSNAMLLELCGQNDCHIQQIEERLGIQLVIRGNQLAMMGPEDQIVKARMVLEDLYDLLQSGLPVGGAQVDAALRVTDGFFGTNVRPGEVIGEDFVIHTPKKKITARSVQQRAYLSTLLQNSLTFGLGPAGTGKTFLATAVAVQMLVTRQVKKLILTRPVMEAGEKLGFLPGSLEEKIDPYLRPFFDALDEMLGRDKVAKWREEGIIEVAPLAYMRGRTLESCVMILDESQNTTPQQMRLFLTRMGRESKAIVTGDLSQSDLPKGQRSGLADALEVLEGLPDIEVVRFSEADVVRHALVARIVSAYDQYDRQMALRLKK